MQLGSDLFILEKILCRTFCGSREQQKEQQTNKQVKQTNKKLKKIKPAKI